MLLSKQFNFLSLKIAGEASLAEFFPCYQSELPCSSAVGISADHITNAIVAGDTIIDIGPAAITGSTIGFFEKAKASDVFLFLIEPHPVFAKMCVESSAGYPNITVINTAISDFNGTATLTECLNSECSSILDVNWDNIHANNNWPVPEFFNRSGKYWNVEVCRLDRIIEDYNIKKIDFIKIDIQGEDLRALKSAGKYLNIIQGGCIEAPNSSEVALYKNQHTRDDCIEFLESNGFEICDIEDNDNAHTEVNIYFKKI